MAVLQKFFRGYFGCEFSVDVCLTDCEGNPLDLTGANITMDVVDVYGGNTLLTASLGNGKVIMIDAPNGIVGIRLTPSDTNTIGTNCSNISVKITFPDLTSEIAFYSWTLYLLNL